MIELVDLHAQYLSIKDEINSAIESVISSSAFVGAKTARKFEEAFAEYTGAKHCVAVGNGTDALEIVIEALEIKGGNIVVPAMTAVPTVEAVVRTGNTPVFCNIDSTYTLDVFRLEKLLETRHIDAIIPVHLFGAPAHMNRIFQLANKHRVRVIEDCAQAQGTKISGIHVGKSIGCFSFYPGKNLGAFGDAGAITAHSGELAEKCRMIRDHGRIGKFDHLIVGRNSRMDGIQAAILEVKLRHLDEWTEARIANAHYYDQHLEGICVLPMWGHNNRYTYHQYPILTKQRDELLQSLKDAGIRAGMHYPFFLPSLPCYKQYLDGEITDDVFPFSQIIAGAEISLPVHEMLSQKDLDVVIEVVKRHYD